MLLSQALLDQLWKAGLGGKVIRVPARNQTLQLKMIANEILKEAERLYESKGMTFVLERKGRLEFYRSFGALNLCRRFHLSIAEARNVRRRAYGRWRGWFTECEESLLKAVERKGEAGEGKQNFLRIRRSLRCGGDVAHENRNIVELAEQSIRSVRWR